MKPIPNERDHYNAAVKNLTFYNLNTTNFPKHPEWALIIMFYEIIHLIERVFAIATLRKEYKHSDSHYKRYNTMQYLWRYIPREVLVKYTTLKNLSLDARYEYDTISFEKLKQTKNNEYTDLKDFFQQLFRKMKKSRI